jgi:hypothetical protein
MANVERSDYLETFAFIDKLADNLRMKLGAWLAVTVEHCKLWLFSSISTPCIAFING